MSSNSLKVALMGLFLVIMSGVFTLFPNTGVWAAIVLLVGLYITLLSLSALGTFEFLRYVGY